MSEIEVQVRAVKSLRGEIAVPGDKSISHRAAIVGALAEGRTEIENFLPSADCRATLNCLAALGVKIEQPQSRLIVVHGTGVAGERREELYGRKENVFDNNSWLCEPHNVLDAANSGTTMRLLTGVLAACPFFSVLTGDESLRRRPMRRVIEPLTEMGAAIMAREGNRLPPVAIRGVRLKPLNYRLPVASAQVKSALLLAGLVSGVEVILTEPAPSRDHTERMLQAFGAQVVCEARETERLVRLLPRQRLKGQKLRVPGDISSAAFFLVAGCILPDTEIIIKRVGINPTRTGLLEVMQAMGADLEIAGPVEYYADEPVADLRVRSSRLKATVVEGSIVPRLIDEIPVLAVAAACAEGVTVIRGAEELRYKESDRVAAVAAGLRRFGAEVEELQDGLVIKGGKQLQGAVVDSLGDHRLAMAWAVAGLAASGCTVIRGAESVEISYPTFFRDLAQLIDEDDCIKVVRRR